MGPQAGHAVSLAAPAATSMGHCCARAPHDQHRAFPGLSLAGVTHVGRCCQNGRGETVLALRAQALFSLDSLLELRAAQVAKVTLWSVRQQSVNCLRELPGSFMLPKTSKPMMHWCECSYWTT